MAVKSFSGFPCAIGRGHDIFVVCQSCSHTGSCSVKAKRLAWRLGGCRSYRRYGGE